MALAGGGWTRAGSILAQSAATAAMMALDANLAVQEVPYPKLRERLLKDGQVLEAAPRASAGQGNAHR